MPIDNENWHRWRGAIDEKMETHTMKIEDHCERLAELEKRVGDILVKLAVPLFLASVVGVVMGGVIVALLTNALRH